MNKDAVAQAVADLIDKFDGYTLSDIGPHLTCGETEALADVFIAAGRADKAETLITGHAEDDDEGDDHWTG